MAPRYSKRERPPFEMRDLLPEMIRDTGYSETVVRNVVESFLAVIQERSLEGQVLLPNFGTLETRLYVKRNWSFKENAVVVTRVPAVIMTGSTGYYRLIQNKKEPYVKPSRKFNVPPSKQRQNVR